MSSIKKIKDLQGRDVLVEYATRDKKGRKIDETYATQSDATYTGTGKISVNNKVISTSANSVSVSETGTSTNEANYITIDDVEYKIGGSGGGGSSTWGQITGTLSNQTDLQTALDGKQDDLTQTQLAAVNSGITSEKVSTYDGYSISKEDTSNKVTTLSSESTDTQYPSGKCVYDNLEAKVNASEKGVASGVATLDSNGKVPLLQINDALLGNVSYQGLWNAQTNTPTLSGDSELPNEYQQVEYVENPSDTIYVKTGYYYPNGVQGGVELDCQLVSNTKGFSSNYCNFFGAYSYSVRLNFPTTTSVKASSTSQTGTGEITIDSVYNRHIYSFVNGSFKIDGVLKGSHIFTNNSTNEVYLLATNLNNNRYGVCRSKYYSCKIYEGSEVVREYVPCYRKLDSVVGLYDLKTNTFLTATGGTLNKGPDYVPSPTPKGHYYVVSVGGTRFGHTFQVGDWIIGNGTGWDKVNNTDAVSSVEGRTGNVNVIDDTTGTGQTTYTWSADKLTTQFNSKQNNLSQAQLDATNSGITSTKVTTYDGYATTIALKENASNKIITIDSSSTDSQYPSAKAVYDNLSLKQNNLTAGTNITIVNDVISSTAQDNSFRGAWNNWNAVPSDATLYPTDIHGNTTPLAGDYLIVQDASDVPVQGVSVITTNQKPTTSSNWSFTITINGQGTTFNSSSTYPATIGNGEIEVKLTGDSNYPLVMKSLLHRLIQGSIIYNVGTEIRLYKNMTFTNQYYLESPNSLSGTWRFHYNGTWATDGKSGWKQEYNVKEVLPTASPIISGITKLYNTTGNNTDGTINQSVITSQLSEKEVVNNRITSLNNSSTNTQYPSAKCVYDFVNSSISTNTAYFLGTLDVVSDLGLSYGATTSAIVTALNSYSFTLKTNNDYCIVINKDTDNNTIYQRYKYNSATTTFGYEYSLNNSSFTQAQWTAINSGINSTLVGNIQTNNAKVSNVQSDWNATSGLAEILNKPTNISAFTNDTGYLTSHQDISGKANLSGGNAFNGTQTFANTITPSVDGGANLGSSALKWYNLYIQNYIGYDSNSKITFANNGSVVINGSNVVNLTGTSIQANGNEIATQSYVDSQGYLTSITSSMITTALGYTPLSNAITSLSFTETSGSATNTTTYGMNNIVKSNSVGTTFNTYTYNYPNKTGTFAMTSDLDGKANTSDLGTQVTYSYSNGTLTITTK